MNAPFLFTCPVLLCACMQLSAQSIPSDVVGDTGWIAYGSDTLVLVRGADGHAWLLQNMGAAQVATASNDAAAFGGLFQWGRWDDGHASPTSITALASTLTPNDPSGLGSGSDKFYIGPNPSDWWGAGSGTDSWEGSTATATTGMDPCAQLGGEWQLPSQADWVAALAAEGITNTATAFSSNLKLAAAGARDGQTGTIINAGLYGQYWSSTPSTVYAKDLTVGDTWVNPDDDALRGYGMCVRCVNKYLHVGVEGTENNDRLGIFPNPSHGIIRVDHGRTVITRINVFGADMRLLWTITVGATSTVLSLDQLANGTYWIKAETTDGGISWFRAVIER